MGKFDANWRSYYLPIAIGANFGMALTKNTANFPT
jgi:hypothetical protein